MRWGRALAAVVCVAAGVSQPVRLAAQRRVVEVRNLRPVAGTPGRFDTLMIRENAAPDSARDFAVLTDVAVDSSGRILAVDTEGRRVIVLDRQGQGRGVVGRGGEGPGEFRLPYLVAVGADGAVIVLDHRTLRLTYYDRDLGLVRTALLPSYLHATSMVAVGNELFIAGTLEAAGAEGKAIHVLTREGQYLRSFGRSVEAANPLAQDFISGGILAPARDGGVWYTQYSPYLIERYAVDGTLQLQIRRPNDFLPSAEFAFRAQVSERGVVFQPPAPHARAAAIQEFEDGTLLHQTLLPSRLVITDVYRPSPGGEWALVGSYQHPGPVLLRRGPGGTFLSLVASEGIRHGGVMVVRFTPAPRR